MARTAISGHESPTHGWRSPELGTATELELPQGRLRYHERGQGPVLVFAHGWLANANLWRKVVATLSRRFRCIVPDLPLGAHLQPMNESFDGSPDGVAKVLNGFLDALHVEEVTLVGNDSGGAYSQIATVARPERVRGLILNACETPYDPFPPVAFNGLRDAAAVDPAALAGLLAALRDRTVRMGPAAFGALIKHPIDDDVSDSYALPVLEVPGVCRDACKVMSTASQDFVAAAGRKLIEGYAGRVTFLWPTDDRFFSLENVRRYASELVHTSVELIEDSFAFTPEDQPIRLSEGIVTAFENAA